MSGRRLTIFADSPAPTVMAGGIGDVNTSQYQVDARAPTKGHLMMNVAPKPPYVVPLMSSVGAIPRNGYTVASTFSGCGGSSLGYTLAGFKVGWACEFVPAAFDTYRANFPATTIDPRDIRDIQAADILTALDLKVGDLDLLDGSPPCASFSSAGKRSAHWGRVKKYSDTKQRTDDLFYEFVRLVRDLQPRVFVAENVSGLVKGVAKGMFLRILDALQECGYHVEARLLDAQWLGVPQMRARLIFQGVRRDLNCAPAFPVPFQYRYSVRDALPNIHAVSCLLPGKQGGMQSADRPCPTVTTGDTGGNGRHSVERAFDGDISGYSTGREYDTLLPGEQSTKYFSLIRANPEKPCNTITTPVGIQHGAAGVMHPFEKRRFSIAELKRICAFPDDFILTGTYAQQWERMGRAVPPLMMRAIASTIRDEVFGRLEAR